jgi:50S ribosomal protein L16 3-hydroxylase
MSLDRILGDLPKTSFIEDFYLRQPFSRPGAAKELCELGSWETVRTILAVKSRTECQSVLPEVDLMLVRQGQLWQGAGVPDYDEVRRLHAEGYTLVVRHAERHDARLAELADGFRRDFLAPVNIHLYCTPAGQFGFGWHYDAEDVFIVQTEGSKEYALRKNTVNPWPLEETLPADMRFEREIMPVMKCRLDAGDWLYIPSGYWHMGQSHEAAISLAIGVMSPTALDVFDFLRPRLLDSLLWRQRLKPADGATCMTDEERAQNYRAVFAELAADLQKQLTDAATAPAFIAQRRCQHGNPPHG